VKLEFAARALQEIERRGRWWVANRPASPQLLAQELEQAFDLIKATPILGSIYARKRGKTIRRVLLPKTEYHLYFRQDGPEVIRVLSVWGAKRERGPKF
jgi:plasmid stabilization system protein ParE